VLALVLASVAGINLWQNQEGDRMAQEASRAGQVSDLYTRLEAEVLRAELVSLKIRGGAVDLAEEFHAIEARVQDTYASLLVTGNDQARAHAALVVRYLSPFSEMFTRFASPSDEPPADKYAALDQEFRRAEADLIAALTQGELRDHAELATALSFPDGSPLPLAVAKNPAALLSGAVAEEERQISHAAQAAAAHNQARELFLAVVLYGFGSVVVLGLLGGLLVFASREARVRAEVQQLRRIVKTDPLTGLGNRRGFEEEAKRIADEHREELVLVMLDLDEFKEVNDTFGHARGDAMLQSFGQILMRATPPEAHRYRIGGDEFAVVIFGADPAMGMQLAETIRSEAERLLGNGVTVSAGVSACSTGIHDEVLLRQEADAALYEAKLRGRNAVVLYSDDGRGAPVFPAEKLAAVRKLLVEGAMTPVFQPIWNLHSHDLLAYEALSRPAAKYGLSSIQEAFDIAERFGRAADLDRLCRSRILSGAESLPGSADVFINLSPYSLTHGTFSAVAIRNELISAGLSPERVVFEITERSQLPADAIVEGVQKLRAAGFRVALDDVGAGNNGLEMLRKIAFEFVKIDRDVIVGAMEQTTSRAALMAILAFAAEAGAIVIAEGVEDVAMLDLVRKLAERTVVGNPGLIHAVQGFLVGRPTLATAASKELPDLLAA